MLTAKTWSELRWLYRACLMCTGAFLELCVQIADQIRRTGVVVPGPYEPPLPFRWAATERQLRRAGGCCESIVHRFGRLVWELVYADDIADELACRGCAPAPAFTDWDSLLVHAKAARISGGLDTDFDLLDELGEPIAGFRLVTDADGREEAELQMHLISPFGPPPSSPPPPTNGPAAGNTPTSVLMNDFLRRTTEEEVRRTEAAAVAVGCPALPPHRPTASRESVVVALRLTDSVLKKAEKFQAQMVAWKEQRRVERKSRAFNDHLGLALTRDCCCCARSYDKPHASQAETGQQRQQQNQQQQKHLATNRKGLGAKGESLEAKRKTATKKADVTMKTPDEQAADFIRGLGDL